MPRTGGFSARALTHRFAAWVSSAFVALLFVAVTRPALAQIGGLPSPFQTNTAETWTGAEATRHSWSTYTGINWSPFGKITQDGLRLRLAGGYGEYRYAGNVEGTTQSIYGTAAFADLLVGYQRGFGPLTLKAFAGATFDGHLLDPFDEASKVGGAATGAKGVLESWLNLSPDTFAQFDLSYATAHQTYNSRLRVGYRLNRVFSIGLEGGAFGNLAANNGRGGAFARYEWLGGELSLSGGISGDIAAPRNPYGTLVYLTRF